MVTTPILQMRKPGHSMTDPRLQSPDSRPGSLVATCTFLLIYPLPLLSGSSMGLWTRRHPQCVRWRPGRKEGDETVGKGHGENQGKKTVSHRLADRLGRIHCLRLARKVDLQVGPSYTSRYEAVFSSSSRETCDVGRVKAFAESHRCFSGTFCHPEPLKIHKLDRLVTLRI